jgi:hypothetical protein
MRISLVHSNPLLQKQQFADIHDIYRVKNQARVVRCLANNLAYLFNIPSSDNLTFIIGDGSCSTNIAAIRQWVADSFINENIEPNAETFNYLVKNMKTTLQQEAW